MASADLNGDSKVDLIFANQGNDTLTVLTNAGLGRFSFNATLPVGNSPQFVVAADINGDGKLDLISVNGGSFPDFAGTLTVLTNNGNGIFSPNSTVSVGGYPTCVAVADVNGDNKPDMITANYNENTLTVVTNNGVGKFGFSATLVVGTVNNFPYFVVAADVNNDGKKDLISADQTDGTLTVLTNNGIGIFSYRATIPVGAGSGSSPYCVAAADINGDDKVDLISADEADGTLTVLTNDGTGGFTFKATLSIVGNPLYIIAADLNGDGKMDLVSASSANILNVFTNQGSGVFGLNTNLPVGSYPTSIVAADLNSDGVLDLASANYSGNTLSVLLQLTAPKLSIQSVTVGNANQFALSWSSSFTNFVVQTNASLTGSSWLTAGYPITASNGTNLSTAITSPPLGQLFFRLSYP